MKRSNLFMKKTRTKLFTTVLFTATLTLSGCSTTSQLQETNTRVSNSATIVNKTATSANVAITASQAPVPMKFVRNGQQVTIDMTSEQTNIDTGNGEMYHAWTFDGTLPGPVIYLEQGDHVTLSLHNIDATMTHSIDLHAALVAPNKAFLQVPPGQTKTLEFIASNPGVYMYHCATPPMLLHIGNGMYGAVVVTPKGVARPDYTIVQSEIYKNSDYEKMQENLPDLVVFNGKPNQYVEHPLSAKVGKPFYIAFVNAGPNLFSAFHIVGTVFDDAQATGNPQNHLYDVQTYTVAPGDGALFKVTIEQPGVYPFVTHSMSSADKGAMGKITVTQ